MVDKYAMPSTSLISFMSNKVKSYGGINFAQGIPGFDPPRELLMELSELAKDPTIHQYAHGQGFSELVDQLHQYYLPLGNFSREQFRITDGATEAIWIIFTYLNALIGSKFTALAFDPVYESYAHLPKIYGQDFLAFPIADDLSVDFEQLEKQFSEQNIRVLFLGSPGNPLGKVWTEAEFITLHALCKKYDVFMIVDAVYKDLTFYNSDYQPYKLLDRHLFFVDSFSKMLSVTGWRVGYYIAHSSHLKQLNYVHDYTGLSSPSVQQMAISNYLKKNEFGIGYRNELRQKLKENMAIMRTELIALGCEIPMIEGGYFIWAKLPLGWDGFRFAIDLYDEERVAVIPGIHFSDKGAAYIRLNIARPIHDIYEGLSRIKNYFQNHTSEKQ